MPRSLRWQLALGMLALLSQAGCMTIPGLTGAALPAPTSTPPSTVPGEERKNELPSDVTAKLNLKIASSLERNGHFLEALVQYEKARQNNPRLTGISRKLAVLYDRLGEKDRALEEYQLALKETPHDPDLLNNFGYYYYTRGKWREAEEQFRAALALNARHLRAWSNLALTLGQQHRYPESLEAFEHAVSKAEAHSNLGFILSTQGKLDEARAEYHKALKLNPELAIARQALHKLDHPGPAEVRQPANRRSTPSAPRPTETTQGPRPMPGREQNAARN